ncbi:MAG: trypsin-like peptidase domain-containing protein [Rubritalea sp.]|uniref:S1C family serine protease n=1 Tax=Rubritalea sp. TaxID=2109375 RepID=UPI003241CFF3
MRFLGKLTLCLWVAALTTSLSAERLHVNDKKVPESREDLVAIQTSLQKHLAVARQATVCIQVGQGSGSGVIVSEGGLVLTAAHVISGVGKSMKVVMEDGTKYEAKSLGLHSENDAGMLQIQSEKKFPFVRYENKSANNLPESRVGDWVFALGHSGGFDKARGSVVRLGRMVKVADTTVHSDCVLIGGDSGGPLFDMNGELIGIHSRVGRRLAQNMHVPLQVFHTYWDLLEKGEFIGDGAFAVKQKPGTGFMGVAAKEVDGVLEVTQVEPGYPAEQAGIEVGDLLTSINQEPLRSKNQLRGLMKKLADGDHIKLGYCRDGKFKSVDLNLVQR